MLTSFLIATTVIILFYKTGVMGWVRRSAGADALVDVSATVGLALLFSGTFMGLMTGFFAGLIISGWLTISRLFQGNGSRIKGKNWTYLP